MIDLLTGGIQEKSHRTLTKENAQRLSKLVNVAYGLFFEFAPDVLTAFIPGGALIARATKTMVGKLDVVKTVERRIDASAGAAPASDLDQARIFQQYAAALRRLTQTAPLVVVLDDLQWADAPSIGLLFHLVRTIEDGALLIVGSYRPDDVAIGRDGGRHPLESTMNEIKRYFGDVWIDLGLAGASEGGSSLTVLLDQKPNTLDAAFRDALLQHTGGHPLFTLELIREMKARGDLAAGRIGSLDQPARPRLGGAAPACGRGRGRAPGPAGTPAARHPDERERRRGGVPPAGARSAAGDRTSATGARAVAGAGQAPPTGAGSG